MFCILLANLRKQVKMPYNLLYVNNFYFWPGKDVSKLKFES